MKIKIEIENKNKEPGEGKPKPRKKIKPSELFRRKKHASRNPAPDTYFTASSGSAASDPEANDSFNASIRSSEPMLTVPEATDAKSWKKELAGNIFGGLLLFAVLSTFCMITEDPVLVAFCLPALIFFVVLTTLDSFDKTNIHYIACGVIAILLLASAIIWNDAIGHGLAYFMDEFYGVCEESQAYIYDRFPGYDDALDTDMWLGIGWFAALLGMLASLIPAGFRRTAGMIFVGAAMLALAYYGLVPAWICIGGVIIALLLTMTKGNKVASLPLLLVVAILFGAVVLIDPGENYAISRADENIRDRIAFRTALIRNEMQDMEDEYYFSNQDEQKQDETSPVANEKATKYVTIAIIVLIVAALAALGFFLYKRFRERQALIRKGLDSSDNRVAVTAMFPYSVRWLKAEGLITGTAPFSSLTEDVKRRYSSGYAESYDKMYSLWREAAYSDHEISSEDRNSMDGFMQETKELVTERWNLFQKLRMLLKYAL